MDDCFLSVIIDSFYQSVWRFLTPGKIALTLRTEGEREKKCRLDITLLASNMLTVKIK